MLPPAFIYNKHIYQNYIKSYIFPATYDYNDMCNLILYGPHNSGKSLFVKHLLYDIYKEYNRHEETKIIGKTNIIHMYENYVDHESITNTLYFNKTHVEINTLDCNLISIHQNLIDYIKQPLYTTNNKYNVFRIVYIYNAEYMTRDQQKSLRMIMESFSKTVKFILETESLSSIIEPIISRCVSVQFNKIPLHLQYCYQLYETKTINIPKNSVHIKYFINKLCKSLKEPNQKTSNEIVNKYIQKLTFLITTKNYNYVIKHHQHLLAFYNYLLTKFKKNNHITELILNNIHDVMLRKYNFLHLKCLILDLKPYLIK